MKIAYLLLVHEYPKNVRYLLSQLLCDEEAEIFVHVDRSACLNEFAYENKRIHFITNRERVTWGGYAMVKATLLLIQYASAYHPHYYCLLSGRDFLLQSAEIWKQKVSESYPRTYMDGDTVVKRWTEKGLDRVHYHFFYIFKNKKVSYYQNRIVRKIGRILHYKRKMPYGMTPYCGSQWWTISDQHMNYILSFLDTHPEFERFYRTVGIPDEQFFHTILLNGEYREEVINLSQTYLIMIDGFVKTFSESDYQELIGKDYVFARKIQEDNIELQKHLEERNYFNG